VTGAEIEGRERHEQHKDKDTRGRNRDVVANQTAAVVAGLERLGDGPGSWLQVHAPSRRWMAGATLRGRPFEQR
jgi:hypothetical protein